MATLERDHLRQRSGVEGSDGPVGDAIREEYPDCVMVRHSSSGSDAAGRFSHADQKRSVNDLVVGLQMRRCRLRQSLRSRRDADPASKAAFPVQLSRRDSWWH